MPSLNQVKLPPAGLTVAVIEVTCPGMITGTGDDDSWIMGNGLTFSQAGFEKTLLHNPVTFTR